MELEDYNGTMCNKQVHSTMTRSSRVRCPIGVINKPTTVELWISPGWRRGVVVSGVRRMNEVNARRARLVPGWVTVNSALHPSGVAESSTSFGWGKGGNVSCVGWQVTLCDPMWHASFRSGVGTLRTAIHLLLTYLLLRRVTDA